MPSESFPLVSVVVPAFNASATIEAALRSALSQSYSRLEVLVVDDGSTDDTRARVEVLAQVDSRIRLLHLPQNTGRAARPRNIGINDARGTFVAFLDADDIWTPRKLEDQVTAFATHPDLVLVYSVAQTFSGVEPMSSGLGLALDYRLRPFPYRVSVTPEALRKRNTIACSSVLARLDSIRRLGGFDEAPELRALEDADLWLRLATAGPVGFIPRIHCHYRIHPGNTSVGRRNLDYLRGKHGIPPFRFRPTSSRVGRLARGLVDVAAAWWLRVSERGSRMLGMPPPVKC